MEFYALSSILLLFFLSFINPKLSLSFQPLISSVLRDEEQSCPYTLIVKTSCFSPHWSRDQITIALSDANGNKVVALRLDESLSGGGFEKCSSDIFQVKGQCLNIICSVYIYRSGPDGWIPETVEIYKEGSKSVKFDFNKNAPENIWHGQNNCNNTGLPPPSPPYFPPAAPSIPPPRPPPPPPSAASGHGVGESLVVAFATILFAFAAVVV